MEVLRKHNWVIILFASVLLISCDYKENEVDPTSGFTKYLNLESSEKEITPVDVVTYVDGSLIVLANLDVVHPYVLHVSSDGNILWKQELTDPYSKAASDILLVNNRYYFTCLSSDGTNGSYLMEIDVNSQQIIESKLLEEITYVLSCSSVSDGILVQSYHADSRRTVITKYNTNFDEVWQKRYPIFEDLEIPTIFNHVTGRSKPLPFFCGELNDGSAYYFNGFSNYNFGLNFIERSNGDEMGVVQGNRYDAAISDLYNRADGGFAISRFGEDGRNYVLPLVRIEPTGIAQGTELGGDLMLQWEDRSNIGISSFTIGSQEVIGFLGTTKTGNLELRIYSLLGVYLGTKSIGGSNFVGYGHLNQSSDGGVIILAQSALENQFFKIGFFKIGKEELEELVD